MKRSLGRFGILAINGALIGSVLGFALTATDPKEGPATADASAPLPVPTAQVGRFMAEGKAQFSPAAYYDPALHGHDERCRMRWAKAVGRAQADPAAERPSFACTCPGAVGEAR